MKYRICSVATSDPAHSILEHLRTQETDLVDHVLVIGGRNDDYKASSLARMTASNGKKGHLFDTNADNMGAIPPQKDTAIIGERIRAFADHMSRYDANSSLRPHPIVFFDDYQHYYHILYNRLWQLFKHHKINQMLFFDMPHLVYDTVAYQVAQDMKLPVLLLRQSSDPNKTFSMSSWEDYGYINPALKASLKKVTPIPIDKQKNEDPHYMAFMKKDDGKRAKIGIRGWVNVLGYFVTREPKQLLKLPHLVSVMKRIGNIRKTLPSWREPFARFFHVDHLEYFEKLAEFELSQTDLTRKYVYFPLHLQPEMTTSTLGGYYSDQLLGLEQLSAILPKDWVIYLKENPKQDGRMRGPLFFHRLSRLPNVELVPASTSTFKLIRNSAFVATISGTAAFEAICAGIPALVFGNIWFMNLPGVTKFEPGLDAKKIAATRWKHTDLELALARLNATAHQATVNRHAPNYANMQGFDLNENTKRVAGLILSLIQGKTHMSFRRSESKSDKEQQ